MDEKKYQKYLQEKKTPEETVEKYLQQLVNYQKFLEKQKQTIDDVPVKEIVNYTEFLVEKNENVLEFLRTYLNYAYYMKRNDIVEALIDIFESFNAMDNLYIRVGEWHGEKVRDEIYKGLTIPALGVHPEKKPEFTKLILKRLDEKLGEDELLKLLKPCLHAGYGYDRNIEQDRKDYQELGLDAFLEKVREQQIKSFEKNRDEGTPAFAQIVDKDVVEYVKNLPTSALGKREGKTLYITKVPYQVKKQLQTDDERMKRFFACYCPWVRGAIKNGTEEEISEHFCQCSGGWYKDYLEKLFEEPVTIEPVETALTATPYCKFAIKLPENVIIKK